MEKKPQFAQLSDVHMYWFVLGIYKNFRIAVCFPEQAFTTSVPYSCGVQDIGTIILQTDTMLLKYSFISSITTSLPFCANGPTILITYLLIPWHSNKFGNLSIHSNIMHSVFGISQWQF